VIEIMERLIRLGLIIVAAVALAAGLAMWATGHAVEANWVWAIGTLPVVAGLAVSMTRDFLAGRVGVDAIALVSMTAALLLGEALAGIVVAVMYAGGNVLEDFAVARAERDLKSLSIARLDWRIGAAITASRTFQSNRSASAT
jgi:cation transport ATPase